MFNQIKNINVKYFLSCPLHLLHKHEILICGGEYERACYSYHTLKNEYKFICEYPSDVELLGHSVMKLADNNKNSNQLSLLSFGGYKASRHTLVMKYVSVWNDDNNNDDKNQSENENETNKSKQLNKLNQLNKSKNHNQWYPFTYNPFFFGRYQDCNYRGARALIGGINNNFVFDLNTFKCIKRDTLPINSTIDYHCFVSKPANGQVQEMMKTNQKNKQNYQMLLFCKKTGLSIEYDEDNNTFQFQKLPFVIIFHHSFIMYMCVSMMQSLHKYSIRENKWMTFKNTSPSPLYDCVAILNEEDNYIHIIGGLNDKNKRVSTHMKTKVRVWDPSQLVMICLF
ncbi:hypothetical protein RFI_32923 [Reticulomyxa filosa]|uniref:Kelch motif family protein n=1 Tax=Reticulomyxa filosa TaxID=46433 RepID=X6LUS8_RETFI|nr:hypothetical protein RFI_32923 [Reticulomyxa filosa]|eukprot:ETO04475.1 hypothetical protein RFI_32923 [Reticulomyxa filosa]